jgi:hypothetical protein
VVGAEQLGCATIPAKSLLGSQEQHLVLPLTDAAGKPVGRTHKASGRFEQATLELSIKYNTVEQTVSCWGPLSLYSSTVACMVMVIIAIRKISRSNSIRTP